MLHLLRGRNNRSTNVTWLHVHQFHDHSIWEPIEWEHGESALRSSVLVIASVSLQLGDIFVMGNGVESDSVSAELVRQVILELSARKG
jgi:hypothetical protein